MQSIEKITNEIKITVDYKVELLGLLITLSDEKYNYQSRFNFTEKNDYYIKELESSFGYLRNHKTVQKFFYLKDKYYLHYGIYIELALSLDDNFEFKEESTFRCKDIEEVKEFCKELKELMEEINFKTFYKNHILDYNIWIDCVSDIFSDYNVKDKIVKYCGKQYSEKDLYVNLIPFETSGGYGILVGNEAHNCLRAKRVAKGKNLFHTKDKTISLFTSIHEYLHSIINPLTKKYNIFNYETNYLYDKENPLPGYGNDFCMINETIIRAMTIRIFNLLTGINNDNEKLELDENDGFKYVKVVYYKLKEYENNRDKYYDIDMFYIEIANAIFEEINNKKYENSQKEENFISLNDLKR